jgi:uncharacterized protein (DUF305 family)
MTRVLAVGITVAAAVLAGCSSSSPNTASVDASRSAAPIEGSAEAGFVRDMSVHHAQAVAMAEAIRDRTTDPDLKLLATNIALGQQGQIGRMAGWLDEWGLPITSTATPMAWIRSDNLVTNAADSMPGMDMSTSASTPSGTGMHIGGDGRMPGMATRPQVSALSTLPIADAEISFLQLMIAHHHAGVDMADAVLARTKRADVIRLATSIVNGQQAEITLMTDMLAKRGATP